MSKINDGGPAFPSHGSMGEVAQEGMSVRDWFAGMAMQGAISTSGGPWMSRDQNCAAAVAEMAYQVADSMLAERSKP